MARIYWLRSARDDNTYVRDREWESAHTVLLWADLSLSLIYKSESASVFKESRVSVLMLALTELLSRCGNTSPGLDQPTSSAPATASSG